MEAREKRRTPVTDWMPRRKGDLWNQIKIETGQSYTPNITTKVKVAWANNSGNVDVVDTSLIRQGDVLEIVPFYTGLETEFNYGLREYALVYAVTDSTPCRLSATTARASAPGRMPRTRSTRSSASSPGRRTTTRHSWMRPTRKGDIIYTHPQRFDSGEITYDTAAVVTPTYENNRQMKKDIADWTMRLKLYREAMLIKGRRVTGDYTSTPKKPYMMGGMVWWAEQNSANINNLTGRQLSIYDLDDSLREKWDTHDLGPGTKVFAGPLTIACLDSFLNPYRQGTLNDTSMTNRVDNLKFRWADLERRRRWAGRRARSSSPARMIGRGAIRGARLEVHRAWAGRGWARPRSPGACTATSVWSARTTSGRSSSRTSTRASTCTRVARRSVA